MTSEDIAGLVMTFTGMALGFCTVLGAVPAWWGIAALALVLAARPLLDI